jgi:hypothetical protein
MKKKIVNLVALFFAISSIATAQFYPGIRVGGNISTISTPTIIDLVAPDLEYLPGVSFGVVGEYAFKNNFSLVSEVNFNEKGFRIRENTDINLFKINVPLGVRVDTRLRYLDVPIMAKYAFGNGAVKAYVAAGPQIGYALNGRIKTRANFLVDFNLTNTPINLSALNYQRFDFGAVVAAGVDIPAGNGKVFIDARYSQGISDSFRLPIVDLDIKNHGFGFGVGYKMAF